MEITGEQIIEKRESLGWTQLDLADYLHITRESVSNYERGKPIAASIKEKIKNFLNYSPVDETEYKKLSISGYYKISVPFISTKSYEKFIIKNEVDDEQIEFITKNKSKGKFIAFEIDTKSMDNNSKQSLSEYDIVLTKEVDKDMLLEEYEEGSIWILLLNDSIICRLIESYDTLKNVITCKPLNPSPDFSALSVNIDIVKRFYKVEKRTTSII